MLLLISFAPGLTKKERKLMIRSFTYDFLLNIFIMSFETVCDVIIVVVLA